LYVKAGGTYSDHWALKALETALWYDLIQLNHSLSGLSSEIFPAGANIRVPYHLFHASALRSPYEVHAEDSLLSEVHTFG
jgi:hypothetical protein